MKTRRLPPLGPGTPPRGRQQWGVAPGPQVQRADSGGICQEANHSLGLKGQTQTWAAWRGRRQINISTTTFQVKTAVQRGKVTCRDAQRQGRDLSGGSPCEPPAQRGWACAGGLVKLHQPMSQYWCRSPRVQLILLSSRAGTALRKVLRLIVLPHS